MGAVARGTFHHVAAALDLWPHPATGPVDKQPSNDPGDDRWTGVLPWAVDISFACRQKGSIALAPIARSAPRTVGSMRSSTAVPARW